MHGPLEVSENEIPVLESCELSRNEPVQSLDLHIVECRIEIETLAENSLFYLIIELMDFWKNVLICIMYYQNPKLLSQSITYPT